MESLANTIKCRIARKGEFWVVEKKSCGAWSTYANSVSRNKSYTENVLSECLSYGWTLEV